MEALDGFEEWPQCLTASGLCREVDDAAKCSICYDFYDTPLLLKCGHSFCSKCIRHNLEFQERQGQNAKCPHCRHPCDARDLCPNLALRELAARYKAVRSTLVSWAQRAAAPVPVAAQPAAIGASPAPTPVGQGARLRGANARKAASVVGPSSAAAGQPGKQRAAPLQDGNLQPRRQLRSRPAPSPAPDSPVLVISDDDEEAEPSSSYSPLPSSPGSPPFSPGSSEAAARPRKRARTRQPSRRRSSANPIAEREAGATESSGGVEQAPGPENHDDAPAPPGCVRCPACHTLLPQSLINSHLDTCLTKSQQPAAAPPASVAPEPAPKPRARAAGASSGVGEGRRKAELKLPPKLCFSMLTEKKLRDELRKFGLPVLGKKQALEERYSRFRTEVLMALDRGDTAGGYASIVRRMATQEQRQASAVAAAAAGPNVAFGPLQSRGGAGSIAASSAVSGVPAGDNFEELIRATRERQQSSRRIDREPAGVTTQAAGADGKGAAGTGSGNSTGRGAGAGLGLGEVAEEGLGQDDYTLGDAANSSDQVPMDVNNAEHDQPSLHVEAASVSADGDAGNSPQEQAGDGLPDTLYGADEAQLAQQAEHAHQETGSRLVQQAPAVLDDSAGSAPLRLQQPDDATDGEDGLTVVSSQPIPQPGSHNLQPSLASQGLRHAARAPNGFRGGELDLTLDSDSDSGGKQEWSGQAAGGGGLRGGAQQPAWVPSRLQVSSSSEQAHRQDAKQDGRSSRLPLGMRTHLENVQPQSQPDAAKSILDASQDLPPKHVGWSYT